MAAKEISVKKYVVRLSGEERERLETLIRKGKSPARRVLKALTTIRRQRNGVPANGAQTETKAENNADKGRAAGATYAAAHTGAGRVAASPRKMGPCACYVPRLAC